MNVHAPEKLVIHLLTEVGLLNSIINNSIDSHFSFHSGRKIRSGYFVTLYEVAIIISESKNIYVDAEEEKVIKWKDYITYFLEPIKQRFKEGLLAPSNNEMNNFGNYDKQFMDFKPFDQQEKEVDEKQETNNKKLPIKDLMKQISEEYQLGKKTEVVINDKKEEMELIHNEDEDNFNNFIHHDMSPHNHSNSGKGLGTSETNKHDSASIDFYDNNYWATNRLIVDEVALEDIMQSL